MRSVWTVVMVACMACSSAGSSTSTPGVKPTGAGNCMARTGTYVSDWVTRSGNCGDISEQVQMATAEKGTPDPPCIGSIAYAADDCSMSFDVTCPVPGSGPVGKIQEKGTVTFSFDGANGSGLYQVVGFATDGTPACSGTYDVAWTKR